MKIKTKNKLILEVQETEALRLLAAQREGIDYTISRYINHLISIRELDTKEYQVSEDLKTLISRTPDNK